MVKLFLFDVGLPNHMLGSSYKELKQQNYEYKGYVAENFVQQEFTAIGVDPNYSWNDARAEIEFILATDEGALSQSKSKVGNAHEPNHWRPTSKNAHQTKHLS